MHGLRDVVSMVTCELCADSLPAAAILDHLTVTHHVALDVQTWPDGQSVIHDETLTPEDFT